MTDFRNGQWVKFGAGAPEATGAHRSVDGNVVGIYQRGWIGGDGEPYADFIAVVDANGLNLMALSSGQAVTVKADPTKVPGLQACTMADVPEPRRSHLPPGYELRS